MNVHWVKTNERKPSKGECVCIYGNEYGHYKMLLNYSLKSEGDIYYTEENDGPDYECFWYDDPEWGFSEMPKDSVLYWLDGLEIPNET